MKNPYLSIVTTTRNDNHGGDLLKRTSVFVKGIYHQSTKLNVPVELIIVEWNPPKEKKLLKDELPLPPKGCPVLLRFIVVPEEIHQTYSMSNRMPLFQMIAKNVGIRRAKGEFILCTNIDLLFSNELFEFLASKTLQKDCFYRANRVDVPEDIMSIEGFENRLSYGEKHIISRLGKTINHEFIFGIPKFLYAFTNTMKVLNWFFKHAIRITHTYEEFLMYSLDTSACGDFTLMHKSRWEEIEGYPELDLYSIHIDSMGIVAAAALRTKQVILPPKLCTYHIYHTNGWESFKKSPVDLIRFMERRPGLDWHSAYETGKWMIKNKKTWGLNPPTWGFTEENFKEYIFRGDTKS